MQYLNTKRLTIDIWTSSFSLWCCFEKNRDCMADFVIGSTWRVAGEHISPVRLNLPVMLTTYPWLLFSAAKHNKAYRSGTWIVSAWVELKSNNSIQWSIKLYIRIWPSNLKVVDFMCSVVFFHLMTHLACVIQLLAETFSFYLSDSFLTHLMGAWELTLFSITNTSQK